MCSHHTKRETRCMKPVAPNTSSRPLIRLFDASKSVADSGELLTLSWEVSDAERVEITPLGAVPLQGTKTLRLPDMQGLPGIRLCLLCSNAQGQSSEKAVWIRNKSFKESEERSAPLIATPKKQEPVQSAALPVRRPKSGADKQFALKQAAAEENAPTKAAPKNDLVVYLLVGGIFVLIAIFAVIVFRLNGME